MKQFRLFKKEKGGKGAAAAAAFKKHSHSNSEYLFKGFLACVGGGGGRCFFFSKNADDYCFVGKIMTLALKALKESFFNEKLEPTPAPNYPGLNTFGSDASRHCFPNFFTREKTRSFCCFPRSGLVYPPSLLFLCLTTMLRGVISPTTRR